MQGACQQLLTDFYFGSIMPLRPLKTFLEMCQTDRLMMCVRGRLPSRHLPRILPRARIIEPRSAVPTLAARSCPHCVWCVRSGRWATTGRIRRTQQDRRPSLYLERPLEWVALRDAGYELQEFSRVTLFVDASFSGVGALAAAGAPVPEQKIACVIAARASTSMPIFNESRLRWEASEPV